MNQRTMIGFSILALFLVFDPVQLECRWSPHECLCQNIHMNDFLDEFYRTFYSQEELLQTTISSIAIQNFEGNSLNYIPKLPMKIRKLQIRNSSLKIIAVDALQHFEDLEELDLSKNRLTNLIFLQYLPVKSIKKLNLNGNEINSIDDDILQDFLHLNYLDLSNNLIEFLDLNFIANIENVNLANNKISKLNPLTNNTKRTQIKTINLHRNILTSYNETELNCTFQNIDISYNNLSIIKLTSEKTFLNLSGNDLQHIRNSGYYYPPLIDRLDLSHQKSIVDPSNWDVEIMNLVKLNNNNIPKLSSCCFNIRSILNQSEGLNKIDISNSSVANLDEFYFNSINLKLLNLSHNALFTLKKYVFSNSSIDNLDLSFNMINIIEEGVFKRTNASFLYMNNNQIEFIKNIFNKMGHLKVLDLRFNKLKILENLTFYNTKIQKLLLNFNQIYEVQSTSFINLTEIKEINLSNNLIRYLERNVFYNLSCALKVDLANNYIETVQPDWFYETPNLKELLLNNNYLKYLYPIPNQIQLETLTLSFTGIFYPSRFMNLHLLKLNIVDSQIHTLMTNSFDGLFNLISLNFNNSTIRALKDGFLNHLYRLKYLDTQNLFKYVKSIRKNAFKDLISMKLLNLSSLALVNLEPRSFLGMKKLEKLLINTNYLNELKINTFMGLISLKILDLSANRLQKIDENSFIGLDNLLELRLNNNNIFYLSTRTFLSLGQLKLLHLNTNWLTEIMIGTFQNLTNLKYLNLSFNRLTTIRNGELSNLKNVEILDLSDNNLEAIESESVFFACANLKKLYLDHNFLSVLDFQRMINFLRDLNYVGISFNEWNCTTLFSIVDSLRNASIAYQPYEVTYDEFNIDGILCRETEKPQ